MLRPYFETRATLARALHSSGRHEEEAAAAVDEALSSGSRDPRLLAPADQIHHAGRREPPT